MAREIVVGYDGSQDAKDALLLACELAYTDTQITVVHAYQPDQTQEQLKAASEHGQVLLEEAAEQVRCSCGPNIDVVLVAKDPAHALADVADERDAFLIIVGSRGLGHIKALLGSVSHRLLHTTSKPVLVVPTLKDTKQEFVAGKVETS